MSFFNFFRRNTTQVINKETGAEQPFTISDSAKLVDKNLFVDEEEPESQIPLKKQINPIEIFLNQNFEWQASNDGYSYPESEYLKNKLKLIKADFRFAVDKYLDTKRSELGELRIHVIRTAGISASLEAQLNEKIKFLEINIHELDMQKILAVEDEGVVASAVHAYRLGFIKGVEKFQQEKLFAASTGLYN